MGGGALEWSRILLYGIGLEWSERAGGVLLPQAKEGPFGPAACISPNGRSDVEEAAEAGQEVSIRERLLSDMKSSIIARPHRHQTLQSIS